MCRRSRKRSRREPAPLVGLLGAQVDGGNLRQLRSRVATGQHDVPIPAGSRVDVTFNGRCRRCEYDGKFAQTGRARHSCRALIWTRSSCLYPASCSSSTTMIPRSAKGRNRADRAPITIRPRARRRRTPDASALRPRERRMPFHGRGAEPPLEPLHELRRQRDFGKHDQRLPALLQRARHSLEIDFRFCPSPSRHRAASRKNSPHPPPNATHAQHAPDRARTR